MSMKDLVSGLESRADRLFTSGEAVDSAALRQPVFDAIARAQDRWAAPQAGAPSNWFSEDNGFVAFSPTMPDGSPLTIDGQTTTFIPADRFADYLVAMRTQVEAGAFDAEIAAGKGGSPNVSGLATVPMPEHRPAATDETRREQQTGTARRDGGPI